jgi:hypothetical protein
MVLTQMVGIPFSGTRVRYCRLMEKLLAGNHLALVVGGGMFIARSLASTDESQLTELTSTTSTIVTHDSESGLLVMAIDMQKIEVSQLD